MEGRSVLIALIGVAALIIAALVQAGAHCRLLPSMCVREVLVDVSAAEDWQDTGMALAAGQSFAITYDSGLWNRCGGGYGCPYTGPEGDGNDSDNYADNVVMGCKHAALIARVGTEPFCVGAGFSGPAPATGQLLLRINDRVLRDNEGSLKVRATTR